MPLARRALLSLVWLLVAAAFAGCGPSAVPSIQQYATVSGTVHDRASGAPIAGATVTINFVLTASTGADGRYTIANVPNGPWSYSASAPNYQAVSSTGPAPLVPGEKRTNFDILLGHV
jgi:predicted metal-binding membrane protein